MRAEPAAKGDSAIVSPMSSGVIKNSKMKYIEYNREERDLCAHLFRLLLEDQPNWRPLKDFLGITDIENPRIFCEVALFRDAYFARKPDVGDFIEGVCREIARQNGISDFTKFHQLPDQIVNPEKTHPRQIRYKLKKMKREISHNDRVVYGSLQGMFNAKPDILICYNNQLIIYEAKYTLNFAEEQLNRTKQIGEIWAKLLYKDLDFSSVPVLQTKTIGLEKFRPDTSWEEIYNIARNYWREDDFSLKVLSKVTRS